VISQNVNYL